MQTPHLAWPFFEPIHREIASSFEHWVSKHLGDFAQDEGNDGKTAREIFERLGTAGWLQQTLPKPAASGGDKIDLRGVCLMRENSAYSSAVADVALSEPWLAILPVALYGSAKLRETYLPKYAAGKLVPAFALSEPDAGSDVAAIATTARLDGDHYIINGRKTWTSNAGLADLYVVFARIEAHGIADQFAAFAIDGKASGLVFEQRVEVSSPHTVGTWRLGCGLIIATR